MNNKREAVAQPPHSGKVSRHSAAQRARRTSVLLARYNSRQAVNKLPATTQAAMHHLVAATAAEGARSSYN